MYKNGSHGMHIHPGNCQLSGTFYVHVEPNSSDIVLCRHECLGDPMNNIQFEEYDNYNSNEWYVPVEKGKLLIWKSDLPHYVISNDSNSSSSERDFSLPGYELPDGNIHPLEQITSEIKSY